MARTTAVTKLSSNYQVVVPKPVRDALGLKSGDLFEATATRDGVLLRPKVLTDRATFLKQLKKDVEASEAAVKAGRYLGPFDDADDAARAFERFNGFERHPQIRSPREPHRLPPALRVHEPLARPARCPGLMNGRPVGAVVFPDLNPPGLSPEGAANHQPRATPWAIAHRPMFMGSRPLLSRR